MREIPTRFASDILFGRSVAVLIKVQGLQNDAAATHKILVLHSIAASSSNRGKPQTCGFTTQD